MSNSRSRTPDPINGAVENTSANRKYTAAIDRVLATFDTIESWPDNIAFLNRLLRVIQTQPTLPLPRAFEISNCLALCVLPKLPSGVQQRALEVYSYIFSTRENLARNLPLYMTGLAPVLGYSSTVVKNLYLDLLSTFVVPLGHSLRPCSTMLVLALLPGLEDEHDESFNPCLKLLDEIKKSLGDLELFWTSLWLACAAVDTGPRSGALNYMLRRMAGDMVEADTSSSLKVYLCADPALFIKAFAAGLSDENSLVQRGFLELLISNVPLSSQEIQGLENSQKSHLLYASAQIVLRRDVGLNRRLWLWLTGANPAETGRPYFTNFAADAMIQALQGHLPSEPVKVNKILLSFLDRDDIGGEMIAVLFPKFVEFASRQTSQPNFEEILVSCRAVFQALSWPIILRYLLELCEIEDYGRALFFVNTFDLTELDETLTRLPTIFLKSLATARHDNLQWAFLLKLSELFDKDMVNSATHDLKSWKTALFADDRTDREDSTAPLTAFGVTWLKYCFAALLAAQQDATLVYSLIGQRLRIAEAAQSEVDQFLSTARELLAGCQPRTSLAFGHVQGLSSTLILMRDHGTMEEYQASCREVIRLCWHYMGPQKLKYEVSSVKMMSSLVTIMPSVEAESFIALLVAEELASDAPILKFGALWTHYATQDHRVLLRTSLMLVIDKLTFGDSLRQSYILRWVHTTSATVEQLFQTLVEPLWHHLRTQIANITLEGIVCTIRRPSTSLDSRKITYHLQLLQALLSRTQEAYSMLLKVVPVPNVLSLERMTDGQAQEPVDILLMVQVALAALEVDLEEDHMSRAYYELCLELVYASSASPKQYQSELETILVSKLMLAVHRGQFELQQLFLDRLKHEALRHAQRLPLSRAMVITLIHGIRQTRQHPVLQDFLSYVQVKAQINRNLETEAAQRIIECIVEQLNLNLIDIDAVLTIREQAETSTAHDNEMLLLDSLELLAKMIPSRGHTPVKHGQPSTPQPNSFIGSALLSTGMSKPDEDGSPVPAIEPDTTLRSILEAGVNVWLWAARNEVADSSAMQYISHLFRDRAYRLIDQIKQSQDPAEILQIFVSCWLESAPENQARLQGLYDALFQDEQVASLCRVIKASLSFSMSQSKKVKEDKASRLMLYTLPIIRTAKTEAISIAMEDSIALLRHLTLHLPFSGSGNAIVLGIASSVCHRGVRTSLGQQKKNKRDFVDNLVKIYGAVTSVDVIENLDSILTTALVKEIPKLPETLLDLEKTSTVLNMILTNIIQPKARANRFTLSASQVLAAVSSVPGFKKVWKREVQDSFQDTTFFNHPREQADIWSSIMSRWADGENDKMNEFASKPNTNTPGHLFVSTDAERQQKLLQLRQLTFLLVAMPVDAHIQRLPAMFARAQEAMTGKPVVQAEALLLFQALILRTSPIHLKNYWTIIVIELHRGFLTLLEVKDFQEAETLLLRSVLRTLDMLLYLGLDDFLVHTWQFVTDTVSVIANDAQADASNLTKQMSLRLGREYQGEIFQSLLRTLDALEPTIGDYIHNVGLLYYDWRQGSLDRVLDTDRVRACILDCLFRQ